MKQPIHSQTGAVEQPIAPIGEILSDTSKKVLEETVQSAFDSPTLVQRASWWYRQNVVTALLAAMALGIVGGFSLMRKIR